MSSVKRAFAVWSRCHVVICAYPPGGNMIRSCEEATRTHRGVATRCPSRCVLWEPVKPLVHAPEAVQSTSICGIGVVDDAVFEHECAHAGPIARVCGRVGPAYRRQLGDEFRDRRHVHRVAAALVVVFDRPVALLILGERDVEVEVEVAVERGRPRKRPPHPLLVGLQLRERRPRHRRKSDVVVRQVDDEAVESVRDRRAGRTPLRIVRAEHEVVDEELRAPSKEVGQRGAPFIGVETVRLVDPNPRQLLTTPRQLVAAPGVLLLLLEQFEPGCTPFLSTHDLMWHRTVSFVKDRERTFLRSRRSTIRKSNEATPRTSNAQRR